MNLLFLSIAAFLIGSVPVGLVVSKAKGVDPRKKGSGNIGATNVLRSVGKKEALITLIGDMSKGAVPVALAWKLFPGDIGIGIVGLSAIAGHDFSIFLKFRGGKGVATSLGVLLAYTPAIGLATVALWIGVFIITRYSSLSAIVAFLLLPVTTWIIDGSEGKLAVSVLITVLIIVKHTSNIKNFIKGEESKVGGSA